MKTLACVLPFLLLAVGCAAQSNDPTEQKGSRASAEQLGSNSICMNGPGYCYDAQVCGVSVGQSDECTPEEIQLCQQYHDAVARGECRVFGSQPSTCDGGGTEGADRCLNGFRQTCHNGYWVAQTNNDPCAPPSANAPSCSGGIDVTGQVLAPQPNGAQICGTNNHLWVCVGSNTGTWRDLGTYCAGSHA